MRSIRWVCLVAAVLTIAPAASRADILDLNDGRRFEGTIVSSKDDAVSIDTRVGSIRATLSFPRSDVKKIEEKALPPGFFEPPPADARVSDAKKLRPDQTLYLEVPITGVLGKDVFAEGLSPVLAYASKHGVQHIVFVIDSPGGDFDDARAFYRLLLAYRGRLRYHMVVRRCQGEALAIGLWATTLTILPGGVFGGALGQVETGGPPDDKAAKELRDIVWSQVARKVIQDTGRTGVQAELVRALVDPAEALAVWRRADGSLDAGAEPPADVAKEQVLLRKPGGTPLELSRDRGIALGMREFDGGADKLGAALKIDGWTAESDYGAKTIARVSAERKKRADVKQAAYEDKVERNITRRDEAEEYIQSCFKEAAQWDPTKGSYQSYAERWNWGWGWGSSYDSGKWTAESQKRWKTRTDATFYYLKEAGKALGAMKSLDADAAKLGVTPTYKPGQIDTMLKDLETKLRALSEHRSRTGG